MLHTMGKRIAQQQTMSRRWKRSRHSSQPASAGPSASTMSAAMLANTCRGITSISICFSRSLRNGLRKLQPVPMRTTMVKNIRPFAAEKM